MSEIEVGEYVRTKKGNIGKVLDITTCTGQKRKKYLIKWNISKAYYITSATITTHSKNIIDLIEEGDIVGVTFWHEPDSFEKFVYDVKDLNEFKEQIEEQIITIDTILTHEQYEQNCYKVVE